MSALVKAGAVVGGIALTIGGGFYVKTLLGEEVLCIPLTKEDGYSSTYDNNKIGKVYGDYLVAPFGSVLKTGNGSSGKAVEDNKKWWEQTYEVFKKDKGLSSEFKDRIDRPYDNRVTAVSQTQEAKKALNKVCEEVYGKASTDIETSASDTGHTKSNLREDLFKYCSFLGKEPIKVSESEYTDADSYGKKYSSKLISTTDRKNDKFWKKQNELFFEKTGDRSGKDLTDTNSIFKKLYDATGAKEKWDSLKKVCEAVYSKQEGGADVEKASKDDVLKFCSLKGKE
ncbi:hypothetical protein MHSWG343_05680 [Candidatus Mycoplasma haematohominis]|uniref:Uncharacterized protein n=1 Tax=Candidatus Mycoplasma haematohominis TaxID=1494318 RepID=A0A478FQ42_9MOLU|nr:hypothetical protein MHSWG343_05680 [Candidatus Mycoplasma haemohominis]